MTTDASEFDDNNDDIHEQHESLTSSLNALTGHHHHSTYESPFTLKTTGDVSYVSHSDDKGLSSDDVGRLLTSDLMPWTIDWMDLSFPVKNLVGEPPFPWIELSSNGAKWSHIWKTSFDIGQGTIDLQVTGKGNALEAYLSFNPTTCLYGPKSLYVARLDDALDVVDKVLDAINAWVTPDCEPDDMRLSRLDVNVTVEPIADIPRVLSIAKTTPIRGATPLATYGKGGRLESVIKRSKRAGGFCIYDKGRQAGVERSAVRFEVTARRCRLRELCPTLGHLSEDVLRKIALKSLQPVIAQLQLIPRNAVSDILATKRELTSFIEMVGLAYLADCGHYPLISTYALRKKYNPIFKKYSARTVGDLLS